MRFSICFCIARAPGFGCCMADCMAERQWCIILHHKWHSRPGAGGWPMWAIFGYSEEMGCKGKHNGKLIYNINALGCFCCCHREMHPLSSACSIQIKYISRSLFYVRFMYSVYSTMHFNLLGPHNGDFQLGIKFKKNQELLTPLDVWKCVSLWPSGAMRLNLLVWL